METREWRIENGEYRIQNTEYRIQNRNRNKIENRKWFNVPGEVNLFSWMFRPKAIESSDM